MSEPGSPPSGVLVVAKPSGMTSHDVVARVRRLLGVRRVGHAGTLDPAATGVLVVGVGRATRLLGYLTGCDKEYETTIRLGATTTTDDADGQIVSRQPVDAVPDLEEVLTRFVGEIEQRPPAVSAVKVAGRRAYARARAGEVVVLEPRIVRIHRIELRRTRRVDDLLDVDLVVACSAGTYIRSLARDIGEALGVGGHVRRLHRTRVGTFSIGDAVPLDDVGPHAVIPLAQVAARVFPTVHVGPADARRLGHGMRLAASPSGEAPASDTHRGPIAILGPDGDLVALVEERDGAWVPRVVFADAD